MNRIVQLYNIIHSQEEYSTHFREQLYVNISIT